MEIQLLWNFLLALGLGAVIGLEREIPENEAQDNTYVTIGGIRFYALMSFSGALMSWFDHSLSTDIWKIIGIILVTIFLVISYAYSSFRQDRVGIVSEFAGIICYFLGVLVMMNYHLLAVILAILALTLFSAKTYLKTLRKKISRTEISNTLKFALISFVILPILPDFKYSIADFFGILGINSSFFQHEILTMRFFNPYSIWFFVVVMAGVEYVGYVLSKILGNKGGAIVSGAVGGLISSTAVTAAMTSKSHHASGNTLSFVVATLIASMIMCVRVIVISGLYNPSILPTILLPSVAMILGLGGSAYYFYRKSKTADIVKSNLHHENYDSPFQIGPALKFAGVIIIIKFIAGIGLIYQEIINPQIFYYALGMISGLADVDAITMDMSGKTLDGSLALIIGATTILVAVISNNIVKASIAKKMWEKIFGNGVMKGFMISIILGLSVIISMNVLSFIG